MQLFLIQFRLKQKNLVKKWNFSFKRSITEIHIFLVFLFADYGFLTLQLKTLEVNTIPGKDVDYDSKVQVFVNDKEVLKSNTHQNAASYNLNLTYKSEKISKDSKVRIEVQAHGYPYDTVYEHEDTIEAFTKNPTLLGKSKGHLSVKSLAMEVSWQGEH